MYVFANVICPHKTKEITSLRRQKHTFVLNWTHQMKSKQCSVLYISNFPSAQLERLLIVIVLFQYKIFQLTEHWALSVVTNYLSY